MALRRLPLLSMRLLYLNQHLAPTWTSKGQEWAIPSCFSIHCGKLCPLSSYFLHRCPSKKKKEEKNQIYMEPPASGAWKIAFCTMPNHWKRGWSNWASVIRVGEGNLDQLCTGAVLVNLLNIKEGKGEGGSGRGEFIAWAWLEMQRGDSGPCNRL